MTEKPDGVCFSLGLVRLAAIHTFCCLCLIGAIGMVVVGVTGWLTAEDEHDEVGTCVVNSGGACDCGEWSRSGAGMICVGYEAAYGDVTFTNRDTTKDNVTCTLKMGAGSMTSCLATTVYHRGNYYSLTPPNFTDPYPCKLNTESYNCFPSTESLHNNGASEFYGLIIAGAIWGFLALCVLCITLLLEARHRGVKHTKLVEDLEEMAEDKANVEREGCFMKGDLVSVEGEGGWAAGRVTGRVGAEHYDVEVEGETWKGVEKSKVRSAGFKEGGWVVVCDRSLVVGGSEVEPGVLGVVTFVSRQNAPSVYIGGMLVTPNPGQVMPTPSVRRGHKIEVRPNPDTPWEPGTVEGVHGDGILLVSKEGCGSPKAFCWIRRPSGIVIEKLPDPEMPEEPATYVFVDPDHRLAPTVMTKEEVVLYGGVRTVSKDLAEYRAAPAGKLLISAALLSSSHLVAQHLSRSDRAQEQQRLQGQPSKPAARLSPPPSPKPTPRTTPKVAPLKTEPY
eukprot:TRINITY_DN16603_c0_g1_i1.p1 TRINITY_DN16603_c0_g1~~TRINITY_DN16603_c0_g1_i1.p1  ORF type:complete len:519 (+),score=21.81 TRINITY_DN16603_c0_g1_i1:46-1557(+)